MNLAITKTDQIGIIASALCMIHCLATPFLFIAKSCSATCCEATPGWWTSLDYLFLLISFFAIHHSSKNTSSSWLKYALWISWSSLLILLINEKLQFLSVSVYAIYVPAIMLVLFHVYNLKYCQCKSDTYCTS